MRKSRSCSERKVIRKNGTKQPPGSEGKSSTGDEMTKVEGLRAILRFSRSRRIQPVDGGIRPCGSHRSPLISVRSCKREKLVRNGLVFRYVHEDDFGKPSGSFVLCNFWLINSLYRIGLVSEARELFENVLTHANHLNLLSEHIDIVTHELLGNFPQAYSCILEPSSRPCSLTVGRSHSTVISLGTSSPDFSPRRCQIPDG